MTAPKEPTSDMRTYHTRLFPSPEEDALLRAYADLYGRVERALFAALQRGGIKPGDVKTEYLERFGITARQFNAVSRTLQGKIASVRELRKLQRKELDRRIWKAKTILGRLELKLRKATPEELGSVRNELHQKERRLHQLEGKRKKLGPREPVRLCFGSRRLFQAQFHLEENGYASQEEWREAWRSARSRAFFVLGSWDETGGCQGCVVTDLGEGRFRLRLRLPPALVARNDGGKYLSLDVGISYGGGPVAAAQTRNEAISYRFLRDEKGWRVFASVSTQDVPVTTRLRDGTIGIDLNADHLAVTETDRHGNPIESVRIPLVTYGLSHTQERAQIGEAVKALVAFARGKGKTLVVEALDFSGKRAALEGECRGRSRMLSGFAYGAIRTHIRARAHDSGIGVVEVDPAYTSVIGRHKFARRYGLSGHQGTALTIARRALHFTERPNRHDPNAPGLPARNRPGHVGEYWGKVARWEAARRGRRRSVKSRPSVRLALSGQPVVCRWDSGTRTASSTARPALWDK
jgi:IS605 OrfB family transposase